MPVRVSDPLQDGRSGRAGTSGTSAASGELISGPDAEGAAARAFQLLAKSVPYLKAEVLTGSLPGETGCGTEARNLAADDIVDSGRIVRCADLLRRDGLLSSVVLRCGEAIGTLDPAVAASLFVQGYSFRLIALVTGSTIAGGIIPNASPAETAVGFSRGRPSKFYFSVPNAYRTPGSERNLEPLVQMWVEALIDGHLASVVDATKAEFKVGARLLWGNIAASAAAAFRTIESNFGPSVRDAGEYFVDSVDRFDGLGGFLTVVDEDLSGWYWERNVCCLYYKLPSGIRCADCSLTPERDRRASFAGELASRRAVEPDADEVGHKSNATQLASDS